MPSGGSEIKKSVEAAGPGERCSFISPGQPPGGQVGTLPPSSSRKDLQVETCRPQAKTPSRRGRSPGSNESREKLVHSELFPHWLLLEEQVWLSSLQLPSLSEAYTMMPDLPPCVAKKLGLRIFYRNLLVFPYWQRMQWKKPNTHMDLMKSACGPPAGCVPCPEPMAEVPRPQNPPLTPGVRNLPQQSSKPLGSHTHHKHRPEAPWYVAPPAKSLHLTRGPLPFEAGKQSSRDRGGARMRGGQDGEVGLGARTGRGGAETGGFRMKGHPCLVDGAAGTRHGMLEPPLPWASVSHKQNQALIALPSHLLS